MWSIIHFIVQCVEDDKQLKIQRDLERGKIVERDDKKDDEDEEGSPFAEYVLLKDFNKMSIKLYKKDENEDDDDDDDDDNSDN
jgi:hypothetical protein